MFWRMNIWGDLGYAKNPSGRSYHDKFRLRQPFANAGADLVAPADFRFVQPERNTGRGQALGERCDESLFVLAGVG